MGLTADRLAWLRSAAAVRARCSQVWDLADADALPGMRLHPEAWPTVMTAVAEEVLRTHPDGEVPIHGRLNHLRGDGWDLAAPLLANGGAAAVDAVVVSVLLDAGAGPRWAFDDPVAGTVARSEGLAVAAHRMVEAGTLSGRGHPGVVDAEGLLAVDERTLLRAFHVTTARPLTGVAGRASLLHALGRILRQRGADRVSELVLADLRPHPSVAAADLLAWILHTFADLWPGRLRLGEANLGDTWTHPALAGEDPIDALVPLHKLSQWMAYSLVEPLQAWGSTVTDLAALTGLAEYRNGGMLVDLGLLSPRTPPAAPLPPGDPLVVEWRALTVAALDRIADELPRHLPPSHQGLGLAQVLEAGTWSLGRRLAAARRPGATPPIAVTSDGTVF